MLNAKVKSTTPKKEYMENETGLTIDELQQIISAADRETFKTWMNEAIDGNDTPLLINLTARCSGLTLHNLAREGKRVSDMVIHEAFLRYHRQENAPKEQPKVSDIRFPEMGSSEMFEDKKE